MVAIVLLILGVLASQIPGVPASAHKHGRNAHHRPPPSPATPTAASTETAAAAAQLDRLSQVALQNAIEKFEEELISPDGCNALNLRVRRDWRDFSYRDKREYIDSVLCLQRLPARTPSKLAPGAKTRFDDFVVTHINKTMEIHYTGTFLAWHRYFVHGFETALRDECGYTGDYPYWDWGADTHDMSKSPVFDGSETSMSGNGVHIRDAKDIQLKMGNIAPISLPAGTGGGCVHNGPFKDYTVNLGPGPLELCGGNVSKVAHPMDYNPRCFRRDLTTEILQQYANYTSIVSLIINNNNIWDFQMAMQGIPGSGTIGVHGGGHYAMGGDPGRDVFMSPGDPAFWLHHGMIDRVWWIWQNLDLETRQNAIAGTGTFLNQPPSPNTTLATVIDLGWANLGPIAMKDLMSASDGPFCYVYR
ncbi:Di-copper centre-containing protein [Penicillium lagena]|uniref:Di-copper centre-containing protein n=1 Tax=Penicillium lagena TaxID=94218 RepID=UPI002540D2B6|nr:Di-copper centre-containing protein [Penicillium lagena]KAJ5602105.1 Di-copper centre-containing protein [Penicillium lagena]